MEKYGVETDAPKDKTASEGTRKCPTCESSLEPTDDVTGVLKCPKCGTKPFEVNKNGP